MPLRLCLDPRCPEPAAPKARGRCQRHARERERQINRAGYSIYRTRRWKMVRRRQLFEHPLCQCDDPDCREIATDVDHIQPLPDGDPWDPANLRSLAHACHSRITRGSQGGQ